MPCPAWRSTPLGPRSDSSTDAIHPGAEAPRPFSRCLVTRHADYQQTANDLKRLEKADVINAAIVGDRLRSAGFYHGRLSPGAVKDAMGIVGQAVEEIGSRFK